MVRLKKFKEIDLVTKEEAIENFRDIKKFLVGTVAEGAPIIPLSAQHGANLASLLEMIYTTCEEPQRDREKDPKFYVVRSFDVNKPGTSYKELQGGILGGSIKEGTVKVGDEIRFTNQDPFFHNIFSLSDTMFFDLGSYPQGEFRSIKVEKPGVVEVECAIHPSMQMKIIVE